MSHQVAFSAVLVVDSSRTAILQFGRCAEKARGKRIFRQLILREFAEFVYPKFPHIVRMRTSSVNTGHWDKKNDGTIIDMRRVKLKLDFVIGRLISDMPCSTTTTADIVVASAAYCY